MNFISFEFLAFFAITFALYAVLSHKRQNLILLVASYIFYGWWDWRFLSLIFISSVVDYSCGRLADPSREKAKSDTVRKYALTISILVNLGILGFFKYFDFFSGSLVSAFSRIGWQIDPWELNIILPVGISFYTFQTMSYTWDVYRGQLKSTDRFLDFMLYVSFFPQLVAGPIERGINLLPQILAPRKITLEKFYSGAQLAFWGFFKKMVIADGLAQIVNPTFDTVNPDAPSVILATYAFAFQIYCDFSGYTDIARGIARMMGFDIRLNFNLPHFSKNPSDFWKRWHISLSSWLRDYLYIPLGGNRGSSFLTVRNLMLTMVIGGLWHGAAWHFILWGAFHGVLLIAFRLVSSKKEIGTESRMSPAVAVLKIAGYFQLTCFGWLLFRVRSVRQLKSIGESFIETLKWENVNSADWSLFLCLTVPLVLFEMYQYITREAEPWRNWSWYIRVPFYLILFYAIMLLGVPDASDFIYFQF